VRVLVVGVLVLGVLLVRVLVVVEGRRRLLVLGTGRGCVLSWLAAARARTLLRRGLLGHLLGGVLVGLELLAHRLRAARLGGRPTALGLGERGVGSLEQHRGGREPRGRALLRVLLVARLLVGRLLVARLLVARGLAGLRVLGLLLRRARPACLRSVRGTSRPARATLARGCLGRLVGALGIGCALGLARARCLARGAVRPGRRLLGGLLRGRAPCGLLRRLLRRRAG